jgi:hypothetical protein
MVSEVTEHPYSVAAGLGIGVIGSVAARVLPGWARAGLLVGGAAYGLYEAYTHKDQINQVIDVEADPLGHSVAERQASIDTLHGLGRGATDLTAAVAGGAIGGLTGMVLRGETSGVIDSMLSKIGIGKGPLFERTPPLGKVFSPTPENPFMTTLSAEKGAPGMPLPGNDNIAGLPRPFVALTAPPERLALPAPSERGGLPALAEQPGLPVVTERSGLPALTEQPGLPVVTERSGLPALTEQPGLPVPTERAVLAGAPEADAPSQPPKQLALPAPPRLLALPAPSH